MRIQTRRDILANWSSINPILDLGEIGLELDTDRFKFGDGVTPWNNLFYGGTGGDFIDGGTADSVYGGTIDLDGGGA